MHKLKIGMILLLTLAVLIAGAFLPKIISSIHSRNDSQKAISTSMNTVQLEITKNISPSGRLVMLAKTAGSIELNESKTKMSKEEVLVAVRQGLEPYINTQLIAYCEQSVSMTAYLMQVPDALELQGVVWIVNITGDPTDYSSIDLIIDDETGRILQISYTHADSLNDLSAEEALTLAAEIFFSALEIEQRHETVDAETAYVYDESCAARLYCIADPKYGEVTVSFFLFPDGFYTECSIRQN